MLEKYYKRIKTFKNFAKYLLENFKNREYYNRILEIFRIIFKILSNIQYTKLLKTLNF